jgi:hypothetical protein
MMTRVIKAAATVTADPVKKSRTFVAPTKGGYQAAQIRASEVQRFVPGTVLSAVAWKSCQRQRTRFVTAPSPRSATYVYQTGLTSLDLPTSGQVGVGASTPSETLFLNTTEQNGLRATAFLDALLTATTITLTSGAKVTTMTNTFTEITKTGSYYSVLVDVTSDGSLADGDVVTITYT